jgi:N-acetyl-anhydromuramyl-L-alanine amidase AmpD
VLGIVLHSTEGTFHGDLQTLTQGPVSAHWYVTRDGGLWHLVADDDTAYHAGKVRDKRFCNAASVGIECEHRAAQDDWSGAQVETVGKLVSYLRQKYGAELPVKGHSDVCAPVGRKTDPRGFPWDDLSRFVSKYCREPWTAVREKEE